MEKKGNAGRLIAVIVLAICIAACVTFSVFIMVTQRVSALNPKTADDTTEVPVEEEAQAQTAEEYSMEYADYSVSYEGEIVEEVSDDEYLCEFSNRYGITTEDLRKIDNLHSRDLPAGKSVIQMVINEMYARHGYQFTSEEIQAYFEQKSWYQAITDRTDDMDAVYQQMSDMEKSNIDYLKQLE